MLSGTYLIVKGLRRRCKKNPVSSSELESIVVSGARYGVLPEEDSGSSTLPDSKILEKLKAANETVAGIAAPHSKSLCPMVLFGCLEALSLAAVGTSLSSDDPGDPGLIALCTICALVATTICITDIRNCRALKGAPISRELNVSDVRQLNVIAADVGLSSLPPSFDIKDSDLSVYTKRLSILPEQIQQEIKTTSENILRYDVIYQLFSRQTPPIPRPLCELVSEYARESKIDKPLMSLYGQLYFSLFGALPDPKAIFFIHQYAKEESADSKYDPTVTVKDEMTNKLNRKMSRED